MLEDGKLSCNKINKGGDVLTSSTTSTITLNEDDYEYNKDDNDYNDEVLMFENNDKNIATNVYKSYINDADNKYENKLQVNEKYLAEFYN